MASFVVETYVPQGDPDRFASDVDGLRAAAAVLDDQVHHVRSYLVPSDEMGFHEIEASSAEDVARITTLARIDVERIVEAVGVVPGRAANPATEGIR